MTGVFIHIPKTGGLSIQAALGLEQHRNHRTLVEGTDYSGLVTFGHVPPSYLLKHGRLNPAGCFFFTFVRNPYDRAVSLWAHWQREKPGRDLDFPAWCCQIGRCNWRVRNPQTRWLEAIEPGFVGRYETLQKDFDELCDVLSIERRALPFLNASGHAPGWTYYDDGAAGIVRQQYAADFERFGYEDNSYLPHG